MVAISIELLGREFAWPARKHTLAERQFQLLVDGVSDYAIYMLDPNGVLTSWNAGAQRIKGYRAEEIVGQNFGRFFTDEDRQAGVPAEILKSARAVGRFEGEGLRVRKNGSRFHAHVVVNALHNSGAEVVGFAKVTRDITERVETQENLRRMQEQLAQSQKMEALGQLTGGMAHDFNNMLSIITSAFQLSERAMERGEYDKVREYIAGGLDGTGRAIELIRRLLAFARQQPLSPKPLDANALVGNMSEILRRTLGTHIQLETVLAGGLWNINADQNQLESSLVNLATNARDAMPEGGRLTIETSNAHLDDRYASQHIDVPPGQYVLIAVTDKGVGMAADQIAKAFEPFFTTKTAGLGTGLGLAWAGPSLRICKAIRRARSHLLRGRAWHHGQALPSAVPWPSRTTRAATAGRSAAGQGTRDGTGGRRRSSRTSAHGRRATRTGIHGARGRQCRGRFEAH